MNNMTVNQAAGILNYVVGMATGQTGMTTLGSAYDFATVAQTALLTGVDPVLKALSQVWSRTIFSSRDYTAKFDSLRMDLPRYGNAVRKLSPVFKEAVDDARYKWPVIYDNSPATGGNADNPTGNGESVDMYKIAKQDVLQTNFYGTAVYERDFTIFRDQFDVAFSSAEEFARFNTMCLTERQTERELYRENIGRALQANLIGGLLVENQNGRVVHLLTEYNEQTGLTLTAQSVYTPENFAPFMRWVYARIKTISRMMTEHSILYQTVINGKATLRHTPADRLRVALYAPAMDMMSAMVLSDTFHDNYLQYATFEAVNFWQSIKEPDSINIYPVYTTTTGGFVSAPDPKEQAGIFGLIHDIDALGYAAVNDWSATTPFNTRGGYWNDHYHSTFKTISDMTEKAVVLLLD